MEIFEFVLRCFMYLACICLDIYLIFWITKIHKKK